jgi:hypothetical protein
MHPHPSATPYLCCQGARRSAIVTMTLFTQLFGRYGHWHMADQSSARFIYGRTFLCAIIASGTLIGGLQCHNGSVRVSDVQALMGAQVWGTYIVALRFQRLHRLHHRLFLGFCALSVVAFPQWSTMGAREEKLLMLASSTFSWLIGHMLELLLRRRHAANPVTVTLDESRLLLLPKSSPCPESRPSDATCVYIGQSRHSRSSHR